MRATTFRACILPLLVALSASGCIMYAGPRTPDLVGRGVRSTLSDAPPMEVILRHAHTMDGTEVGGQITEATTKEFAKAWEKVKPEFPFLAAAGVGVNDPRYVLELDSEIAEQGKVMAIVSGATLMLIPAPIHSDVIVRATLKTINGEAVGKYEARGSVRGAIQILLLPLLPVMPFVMPGKELYEDTMRDALIQVGQGLETLPAAAASRPAPGAAHDAGVPQHSAVAGKADANTDAR